MESRLSEAEIAEIEQMAGAPEGGGDPNPEPAPNPIDPIDGGQAGNTPPETPAEPVIPEGYVKFNEVFQGYEKPEDVLATLTKAKEYEAQVSSLSSKISEMSNGLLPGETEELYKLRMINQKNPDKFDLARKLISNTMGQMDMIKESLKMSPEMQELSDEEIEMYLQDKYSIDKPEDEDDEVAMAKYNDKVKRLDIQKKIDAAKAKNELMGIFSNIELPKQKTTEEIQAEQTKKAETFVSVWKPVFQDAKTAPVKISAPVKGEDGSSIDLVDIEVPAELKEQYLKDLGEVFFRSNVELNDKSRGSVTEYIQKRYFSENFQDIISTVAQKVREMSDEQWMKISFNPRSSKGVEGDPPHTPPKVTTESEFERVFNNS